jgi:hypothetical protein
MEKKVIYLDGMGNPNIYFLNHCEVIYNINENKKIKVIRCSIMWGYPVACEGCPRDKVLQELIGGEPSPQTQN